MKKKLTWISIQEQVIKELTAVRLSKSLQFIYIEISHIEDIFHRE